jgi:hypothetical protein
VSCGKLVCEQKEKKIEQLKNIEKVGCSKFSSPALGPSILSAAG